VVAYSFARQFVGPILQGTKRQTIRGERRRHARPGEFLQLYTAMRTKYCRPIGVAICQVASPITIDFDARRITYQFGPGMTTVYPGGLDGFAQSDGFADWPAMLAFWTAHHPAMPVFNGRLIRWTGLTPARTAEEDGM
jgi:hypothetical protein